MNDDKIPKIIHYCWFGGNPLPELAKKCIQSWKKHCPDYKIMVWNEDTFDVHCCKYVEEAYQEKKWAFVSDVARLYALVNYGGIYMDTDVEVLKPLDNLLKYEAVSGFESDTNITTGLMATCKDHRMFIEFLHEYDDLDFRKKDGSLDLTTNVVRITNACLKYGFVPNNSKQTVNGFTLLPKDYLCPKDSMTKELKITNNTLVIHHFDGSWMSEEKKYQRVIANKICKVLPYKIADYLGMVISTIKYRGIIETIKEIIRRVKKRVDKLL